MYRPETVLETDIVHLSVRKFTNLRAHHTLSPSCDILLFIANKSAIEMRLFEFIGDLIEVNDSLESLTKMTSTDQCRDTRGSFWVKQIYNPHQRRGGRWPRHQICHERAFVYRRSEGRTGSDTAWRMLFVTGVDAPYLSMSLLFHGMMNVSRIPFLPRQTCHCYLGTWRWDGMAENAEIVPSMSISN